MQQNLYRGWSTEAARKSKTKRFLIVDIETVKQDLYNHIWTVPGERMMHPTFGTRLPLLAFEPLDEKTLKIVEEDIKNVINFEPRVKLIDFALKALPENHTIICIVDLLYLELNVQDTWRLEVPVGR